MWGAALALARLGAICRHVALTFKLDSRIRAGRQVVGSIPPMKLVSASLRARASRWLPLLAWAAVIFWLSATPNLRVASADNVDFIVRKAGHMCAFGILAILFWRVLAPSGLRRAAVWGLAWVLTVAYAATDEFHQSFTRGRHPSPVDVGIDTAGALIGLLLLVAWFRIRARRIA